MSLGKRLALNTSVQIGGRVLGLFLSAWLAKLLFNALQVEGYAEYGTIFSYIQNFGAIGDLGLFLFLVRALAQNIEPPKRLLGNAFGFRILAAIALILISIIIVLIVPDSIYSLATKTGIIIGSFITGVSLLFQALAAYFQQRLMSIRIIIPEIIGKLLTVLATIYVLACGGGLIAVIWAAFLGVLITLVFGLIFIWPKVKVVPLFEFTLWKKFYPAIWPMAIVVALTLLHSGIDRVILSLLKGAQSTPMGLYSTAYKFYDLALVAPGIVAGNLFPVISATYKKNEQEFKRALAVSANLSFLGGVIASFTLFALAPWVILLLANESYIDAAMPLRWLSLALAVLFLSQHMTNVVLAADAANKLIRPLILVSIINAAFNIVLIPFAPILVPAIMTLITESILLGLKIRLVPKEFKPQMGLRQIYILILGIFFGFLATMLTQALLSMFTELAFLSKIIILGLLSSLLVALYMTVLRICNIFSIEDVRLHNITYD